MSRLIRGLVIIVMLVGALQWAVPWFIARDLASELAHYDHGPKPAVVINAIPFWQLASGKFQDISVSAKSATVGPLAVSRADISWSNGQVSVAQLTRGHLKVEQEGQVRIQIQLDEKALSALLKKQGQVKDPEVTVKPGGVGIKGRLLLGGTYLPLNTQGTLVVSSDHKSLIFHPKSIDGLNLPLMTDMEIFSMDKLKLPLPMEIQHVAMRPGALVIFAGTP